MAATDLPQYAAFYYWQLPPFTAICRPGSTPLNALQHPSIFSHQRHQTPGNVTPRSNGSERLKRWKVAMTLTPPQKGDLADQGQAQRLAVK